MSSDIVRRGLEALLSAPVKSVYSIVWPNIGKHQVNAHPLYKNNFTEDNGLLDRFLRVTSFIPVLDVSVETIPWEGSDTTHVQFKVRSYLQEQPLLTALKHFELLAKYVPDNSHGNQLLAALLSTDFSNSVVTVRHLSRSGYSVFQENPLALAHADYLRSVVWESVETLVYDSDEYGELRYPQSIRIPLQRADGCPFYDIALMGVVFSVDPMCPTVDWRFAFRMTQESPWSLLTSTKTGESSVRNQVLKYSRRKWVCENSKRPFTDKGEWPYLP